MENLSENLNITVEDKFSKTYSIIVNKPPRLTHKQLKQINMMNSSIKNCTLNLEQKSFKIELMKHGNRSKKRSRDIEESIVPKTYDLTVVDKKDKQHIRSILGYFKSMTDLEFSIDIKKNTLNYDIKISDIDLIRMKDIVRAFDNSLVFIEEAGIDFPQSEVYMIIRKIN
tara:strand:+ start:727 stop:1236 length:510 start_codon:yes stop_codon:yes gene_type:complete